MRADYCKSNPRKLSFTEKDCPNQIEVNKWQANPFVSAFGNQKTYKGEKRRKLLKADQGKIKQRIPNLVTRWEKIRERFGVMVEAAEKYSEAVLKHEVIGGIVMVGGGK